MEFKWNKENVLKILKLNNEPSENPTSPELIKAKKNIFFQAGLAVLTIILTIVIIFSMTSAWYTNIVQTSGLVFEVESWGYSGEVSIDETVIPAGPGDNGVVGLSVIGGSEDILEVKINVSKQNMNDNMKERMFFYVDATETVNGETVERVYVNQYEDYSYILFSQGSILMSESFSNVPELKWQWVYDVLGYYILAEEATDESGNVTGITVKEYLRPIEYNLDEATFKKVQVEVDRETANVTAIDTVDGIKTPENFIEEFSKKDGYPGSIVITAEGEEIVTETFVSGNKTYYKVATDENGYGIYAYLCNISEIEESTDEDTAWGSIALKKANGEALTEEEAALLSFEAKVSVSVEQKYFETAEVSDASALQNKIDENSGKVIKLTNSIEATEAIFVPSGADVWIDLNGHTVTTSVDGSRGAIRAEKGSSLTMLNGTVEYGSGTKRGIEAVGAEMNLSNVDLSGFEYGVYIGDNLDENTGDSVVRMTSCEMDSDFVTVFISGNGVVSDEKAKLIIENCTLTSNGYAVSGNGTVAANGGRWGTDIQVINSTLTSRGTEEDGETWGTAIYHPQKDSTLTVYNSTVSGPLGIVIKGGFAEIIDSKVTANGDFYELKISNSGFSNTGDAIYIETNYGYGIGLVIRETGATDENGDPVRTVITSHAEGTQSLRVFEENSANVSIEIISGIFSPAITDESWISENSELSSGNTVVTVKAAE